MSVSLRGRLLVGVLVLVSVALVVAALAIYAEQRSYLYNRLDQRVVAAAAPISYALGVDARLLKRPSTDTDRPIIGRTVRSPLGKGLSGFLPSGTYGALVDRDETVLRGPVTATYGDLRLPAPRLPSRVPVTDPGGSPRLFTVGSRPGSSLRYRVAALGLASGAGTILVAIPLREVDQTLDRLVLVEALVVASVIIALVGLGWVVIRVALRPLDQMGRVATAIADGDLSRRVSPSTPRTEVGRLGRSLNRMLVRIEEAFADRARSEERRRQFLSDASHELRTPLASIRGYAELFRLGPAQDPDALERAMARIESEATRMGVLVEDLLALAQLDELPEARRVPVDLGELAAQAAVDARVIAPDPEDHARGRRAARSPRRSRCAASGAIEPDGQCRYPHARRHASRARRVPGWRRCRRRSPRPRTGASRGRGGPRVRAVLARERRPRSGTRRIGPRTLDREGDRAISSWDGPRLQSPRRGCDVHGQAAGARPTDGGGLGTQRILSGFTGAAQLNRSDCSPCGCATPPPATLRHADFWPTAYLDAGH